jgi:hypothetical protein
LGRRPLPQLRDEAVVMTGRSDTVVYDCEFEVYRIRTGEGVLLGTEYGGCPCGWDTRTGALETVERRGNGCVSALAA